jgi:hypothetical protein
MIARNSATTAMARHRASHRPGNGSSLATNCGREGLVWRSRRQKLTVEVDLF